MAREGGGVTSGAKDIVEMGEGGTKTGHTLDDDHARGALNRTTAEEGEGSALHRKTQEKKGSRTVFSTE